MPAKQKSASFQKPGAATETACPPEARKLNAAYKTGVHVYEKLEFGHKTSHTKNRKLLVNHPVWSF